MSSYTAQYPTSTPDDTDLYTQTADTAQTTLSQNITAGSPAATGKLYIGSKSDFSTNGGVCRIHATEERIAYSGTGTDGTGDFLTVAARAVDGGGAAASAASGTSVTNVWSHEHGFRLSKELLAVVAELNKFPRSVSFTIGAEAAGVRNVQFDLEDITGTAISDTFFIDLWITTQSDGSPISGTNPDSVTATIGEIVDAYDATNRWWKHKTNASGQGAVDIDGANGSTVYMVVQLADRTVAISSAITFAA